MAESTTRKVCSRAKTMFGVAVRKRLLTESPFSDMKKLAIRAAKKFTVTREMADKVLDACIDNEWRLIFALCRYGGLRCPSELVELRWDDIDWERGRMTVRSPKTEHHEGKESRSIPLFPELLAELEKVAGEANPGIDIPLSAPIITRYRKANANLRTQLERTIKGAGLDPWPVLFNSLRSSRDTELRDQFPDHVVNAWMGHTQKIAEKHYLQVTDAHFEAACTTRKANLLHHPPRKTAPDPVHSPVPGRSKVGTVSQAMRENVENCASSRKPARLKTPPVGLEPTTQRLTAACSTN